MDKYLSQDVWKRLLSTYRNSSYEEIWDALFECHSLFRETSKFVANKLGYRYPDYDDKVIRYIRKLYQSKAEKRPGS